MHTIAICLCVYSLGSLHMSLVLSVDDLVVVRKWHILNRDACDAKIKLEKNKPNPNFDVLKILIRSNVITLTIFSFLIYLI